MSPKIIKAKAGTLVQKYKTRNPFEIAEQLGIALYFRDDFQDLKGMYSVIKRRRCIFINSNLSEEEQLMVCAHELGHDALHRDIAKSSSIYEYSLYDLRLKPEYEACAFASHILFDKYSVDKLLSDYEFTSRQVAAQLNKDIRLLHIFMNEHNRMGADYNIPFIPNGNFIK